MDGCIVHHQDDTQSRPHGPARRFAPAEWDRIMFRRYHEECRPNHSTLSISWSELLVMGSWVHCKCRSRHGSRRHMSFRLEMGSLRRYAPSIIGMGTQGHRWQVVESQPIVQRNTWCSWKAERSYVLALKCRRSGRRPASQSRRACGSEPPLSETDGFGKVGATVGPSERTEVQQVRCNARARVAGILKPTTQSTLEWW